MVPPTDSHSRFFYHEDSPSVELLCAHLPGQAHITHSHLFTQPRGGRAVSSQRSLLSCHDVCAALGGPPPQHPSLDSTGGQVTGMFQDPQLDQGWRAYYLGWMWLLLGYWLDGAGDRMKAKQGYSPVFRGWDCFWVLLPQLVRLPAGHKLTFSKWPFLVLDSTGDFSAASLTCTAPTKARLSVGGCRGVVALGEHDWGTFGSAISLMSCSVSKYDPSELGPCVHTYILTKT